MTLVAFPLAMGALFPTFVLSFKKHSWLSLAPLRSRATALQSTAPRRLLLSRKQQSDRAECAELKRDLPVLWRARCVVVEIWCKQLGFILFC